MSKKRARSRAATKAKELLDSVDAEVVFERPKQEIDQIADGDVLVTCAQNNTLPHAKAWATLRNIADHYGARLVVIPTRYKNPTSWTDPQEDRDERDNYWWHQAFQDHMVENDFDVHPRLRVMGQMRLQATSPNPLSGLEGLSRDKSAIYGHPQVQMRTVPTGGRMPKILRTTGSATAKNYSRTAAGKRGEFHHTHGGVLVRKAGGLFFMRHLNFSDSTQTICDVNLEFSARGVRKAGRIAGLVTGDEHARWACERAVAATYLGPRSMVAIMRPRVIVRHDVQDSYSISHHHGRDPVRRLVKRRFGYDDAEAELRLTVDHIDRTTPKGTLNVIVASNHHEHLMRWLREADPKTDPTNAILYHDLMAEVLRRAIAAGPGAKEVDAFRAWVERWGNAQSEIRFLARTESFQIKDIECGYHSDVGTNGSTGSPTGFARLGVKAVGGHGHGPLEEKGFMRGGHLSRESSEYGKGPSSAMQANVAIYENGKRQVLFIIDGEWDV